MYQGKGTKQKVSNLISFLKILDFRYFTIRNFNFTVVKSAIDEHARFGS